GGGGRGGGGGCERGGVGWQARQPIGRQIRGRDHRGRVAHEDPQPGAPLARPFDLLHGAQADADLEAVALAGEGVGGTGARGQRIADQSLGDPAQVAAAHAPVPPTVRPSMRTVGRPTPTGTDCPSLPQVPSPSSSARSLPTRVMRVSTSGPLPIRVASRTGRPTTPPSIT